MLNFIGKKLLQMIPMLLLISFIVFGGLQLMDVDPISYMLTPDMAASAENQEALREQLGLNDPFIVRYVNWVKDLLKGNFGYSIVNGSSIANIVRTRLPATFELAIIALILSSIIGIGIGILSAIRQNGIIDYVGRVFAVLGQSIPQFFFGICMVQIFAIKLGWLPVNGRTSPGASGLGDAIVHLVLPVLTMTVAMCAVLMRYSRNTMLDVLNSDYIKTARSKGIPEWKVYIKHGFRNAMRPVLVGHRIGIRLAGHRLHHHPVGGLRRLPGDYGDDADGGGGHSGSQLPGGCADSGTGSQGAAGRVGKEGLT